MFSETLTWRGVGVRRRGRLLRPVGGGRRGTGAVLGLGAALGLGAVPGLRAARVLGTSPDLSRFGPPGLRRLLRTLGPHGPGGRVPLRRLCHGLRGRRRPALRRGGGRRRRGLLRPPHGGPGERGPGQRTGALRVPARSAAVRGGRAGPGRRRRALRGAVLDGRGATELEALVTDPTNPQNLINCPPGGGADGCHLETKVSNLHRQSLCIDADALSVQAHPHQLRVQLQRALHLVSCGRSVSLEAFRSPRGRVGTTTTSTRCPMASASRSTTRVLAEVLKHRGT